MNKYQLILEGNNFLMESDGIRQKCGFYTTRWVEAENPKDAEKKAVELIRSDDELKNCIFNNNDDPPMIYLDKINELKSFSGVNPSGKGYTFFQDES